MTEIAECRVARVALTWLTEPGTRSIHQLVAAVGPVEALHRVARGDHSDPRTNATVAARIGAVDPREVAHQALGRAARLGARIVVPEDAEWPTQVDDLIRLAWADGAGRVAQGSAPPLCLWARGTVTLSDAFQRSVAVVGARAPTAYGRHVGTEFGYGLADRGWTVVSGGAYGIDAAAHHGALAAGGVTVAVLACGIDRPYPTGNTALFDQISKAGLLVSEWLPGADPLRHRFLIRNRLIAAATAGTVVVEAAARSGATQTARRAIALGRQAMVVPGPVTSAMSVGCHELLRTYPEARLVAEVPHVLEEIGRIGVDLAPPARGPQRTRDRLDEESALILESVPGRGTISLDALAARAGVDLRTTLRRVSALEAQGFLIRRDGGYRLAPGRTGEPPG